MPQGLFSGAAVRIVNLVRAAHLNGSVATCIRWNADMDRWFVRLSGGDVKAIKSEHLESMTQLSPGADVRICGLVNAVGLNNSIGTCIRFLQETDRWIIRFPDGEERALKPENLVVHHQRVASRTNADARQTAPRLSRSRSRSASADRTLSSGPYHGRRYRDVFEQDPEYCYAAVSQPMGRLNRERRFVNWLREQLMSGARPGRPIRTQPARPPRGHGVSCAMQPQPRENYVDQLPRVPFKKDLFSGSPHPEECPICLEEWQSTSGEIVLTPCLHVFHVSCLGGWIVERNDCPTCRWDLKNTGEENALRTSVAAI
eukprot:TRINITY_DN77581_c0_g1_i1.p1 TRINITY_DN77581_c0_g1~~TRINITY_DN77581_c0_g1_i1.p1  ORF type:complete len:315 (+),score=21.38 TRINITY_DN77581_c0_g1_i1:59-1003(+)